jgi:hypothetical protein
VGGEQADGQAERREIVTTVGVTAVAWLVFSSLAPLRPLLWFVTLVHEAGHAVVATLVGADVASVTINSRGGGLTNMTYSGEPSSWKIVLVAAAGYVGASVVGGVTMEVASRLKRGRVALFVLAALVAAIGIAWVPWTTHPTGQAAAVSGSGTGDGRFTVFFCIGAVVVLVLLALQRSERVRRIAMVGLATVLCLASIDDLRNVLDISSRGWHSDAAIAASATPLSSWMWSAIWLLIGVAACGLGIWSALSHEDDAKPSTPSIPTG